MGRLVHQTITVQGVVQGVGFRPFIHGLASRLGLQGTVRNDSADAVIEVEGREDYLRSFIKNLVAQAPPLAMIEQIRVEAGPVRGYSGFSIQSSVAREKKDVFISPDKAPCEACLGELEDVHDRRFDYPFLNCTNCGPRFTIVTGVPYDRERTTMAGFPMCQACQSEYEDPSNRRFHAQPVPVPPADRIWPWQIRSANLCP